MRFHISWRCSHGAKEVTHGSAPGRDQPIPMLPRANPHGPLAFAFASAWQAGPSLNRSVIGGRQTRSRRGVSRKWSRLRNGEASTPGRPSPIP